MNAIRSGDHQPVLVRRSHVQLPMCASRCASSSSYVVAPRARRARRKFSWRRLTAVPIAKKMVTVSRYLGSAAPSDRSGGARNHHTRPADRIVEAMPASSAEPRADDDGAVEHQPPCQRRQKHRLGAERHQRREHGAKRQAKCPARSGVNKAFRHALFSCRILVVRRGADDWTFVMTRGEATSPVPARPASSSFGREVVLRGDDLPSRFSLHPRVRESISVDERHALAAPLDDQPAGDRGGDAPNSWTSIPSLRAAVTVSALLVTSFSTSSRRINLSFSV